ncbi:MAG TPA: gluconokinase [Thermoanaerobaculia bacterium]|nr:gluconokinase [Thermoanaerobaculia bacterium]
MIVVVMGVSGSGKTTIGRKLAGELGWLFYEGDDFHSAASVEKMSRGIALTDDDRRPWLAALRALIEGCLEKGENAVLACSALKESYRRILRGDDAGVVFVYLAAPARLIAERLEHRAGHFAQRNLLPSQLATLEEPEDAITVDASGTPAEIVAAIREALAGGPPTL